MPARRALRAALSLLTAIGLLLGLSAVPAAAAAETGAVAGTFLRGVGRPLVVEVGLRDLSGNEVAGTSTDTEGRFRFGEVPAGQYRIGFYGPGKAVQYWPRQVQEQQGGIVTVTAGGTAQVEETALPLGELEIKVTDRATGQPVAGASLASRGGPYQIWADTDAAGVAKFGLVRAGTYPFSVIAGGYMYDGFAALVQAEETTRETRSLVRTPGIAVEFTAAATGAAVANACVQAVGESTRSVDPRYLKCAQGTGKVTVTDLPPGRFRLFAVAGTAAQGDGVHGSQWVGPNGGTGDVRQAKAFDLRAGETAEVRVRFDGAGSITGAVTDARTGAGVTGLCPTVTPADPRLPEPWGVRCAGTDGRYTIDNLGPYDWPVQFPDMAGRYAWQWSGDKSDRFSATPVRVTAGAATALDARLRPAAKVTGRITGNTVPFEFTSVAAYNAHTGDPAGPAAEIRSNGQYWLSGLNTQEIKISYYITDRLMWYPRPVHVTAGLTEYGLDLRPTPPN